MNKEIIFKVDVNNAKDAKFVFLKMDEVSDLVGMDKVEFEMRNKKGFLHILKRYLKK